MVDWVKDEDRYREHVVMTATPDGFLFADAKGRWTPFLKQARRWLGFDAAERWRYANGGGWCVTEEAAIGILTEYRTVESLAKT